MSAINAINLRRFFLKFIPQDPDPDFFADPDPWTQKNADPADLGSGSASLQRCTYMHQQSPVLYKKSINRNIFQVSAKK